MNGGRRRGLEYYGRNPELRHYFGRSASDKFDRRLLIKKTMMDKGNPYETDIRNYFDISAGVRGSARGHGAAVGFYREIEPLLDAGRTEEAAKRGLEKAEKARRGVANLIGCPPRNVFFGNSATRTLIPIFLALGRGERYNLAVGNNEYCMLYGIVARDGENIRATGTRQNFGGHPDMRHLRCLDDAALLEGMRGRFNIGYLTAIQPMEGGRISSYIGGVVELNVAREEGDGPLMRHWSQMNGTTEKGGNPLIVYWSHINRETGQLYSEQKHWRFLADMAGKNPASVRIVDASHSAGVVGIDAPALGDVVIMNSSKGLGGEPTIGVCYVSDRILGVLEAELGNTEWPGRIAFQFSPETGLGARTGAEAAACTNWISLPELASLAEAVDGLDVGARASGLRTLHSYFDGMLARFQKHVPCMRVYSGAAPNFIVFVLDGQGMGEAKQEEIMGFAGRLKPYVINSEPRGERLVLSGVDTLWAPFISDGTGSFRVSWSHEHTLEDAKGLCKKIAEALDSVFGSQCVREINGA